MNPVRVRVVGSFPCSHAFLRSDYIGANILIPMGPGSTQSAKETFRSCPRFLWNGKSVS